MKILSAIVLCGLLAGCVVEPAYVAPAPAVEVVYEPDVYVGGYYIGYYREGFGYWTGVGWDIDFYAYGHPGYGHFYRGCPHRYYNVYRAGPHFHSYRGHWHR